MAAKCPHILGKRARQPVQDILLFSYGTLRLPSMQVALFGRLVEGVADAMSGFRKRMIEISDAEMIAKSGTRWHPMVEPSDNADDAVEGLVFHITAEDLTRVDAYEIDYVRSEVRLRSGALAYAYGDRDA